MKNKSSIKNKILEKIFNIAYIIFTLLFSITLISSFFHEISKYVKLNMFISLLAAMIIIAIWFLIYNISKKVASTIGSKTKISFICIIFAIIIIYLVFLVKKLEVPFGWDFETVYNQARGFVEKHDRFAYNNFYGYLQLFPNNIALFVIEVIVMKITSIINVVSIEKGMYMFNAAIIFLSVLFMYLYMRKKYDPTKAYISLLVSLFFIPLYAYVPIFYSDTLSLIFVPLLLYIYANINFSKFNINSILRVLLFSIVLFVGIKLKMTVIFIFIGILIDIIYKNLITKETIKNLGIILLTILALNLCWNKIFEDKFKVNNYGSIPITHWIMMGIEDKDADNSQRNSVGGWNGKDYDITQSYKTGEDSKKRHKKEIVDRIKKFGLIGYIDFLNRKNVNIWGDGTYFSSVALSINNHNNTTKIQKLLTGKDKNKILLYIEEGVQIAFLIIFVFSGIYEIRKRKYDNLVIHIPMCLIYIFLSFWEARSRYIYNFIPLYIMLIAIYIDKIRLKADKKIDSKGSDKSVSKSKK